MQHEFFHTLGFSHVNTRYDRDNYLDTDPSWENNINCAKKPFSGTSQRPYDSRYPKQRNPASLTLRDNIGTYQIIGASTIFGNFGNDVFDIQSVMMYSGEAYSTCGSIKFKPESVNWSNMKWAKVKCVKLGNAQTAGRACKNVKIGANLLKGPTRQSDLDALNDLYCHDLVIREEDEEEKERYTKGNRRTEEQYKAYVSERAIGDTTERWRQNTHNVPEVDLLKLDGTSPQPHLLCHHNHNQPGIANHAEFWSWQTRQAEGGEGVDALRDLQNKFHRREHYVDKEDEEDDNENDGEEENNEGEVDEETKE